MEKQKEMAQENKELEGSHKKAFLKWAILAGLGSGFLRDTLDSSKEQKVGEKLKSTGVFEISGDLKSRYRIDLKIKGDLTIIHVGQIHGYGPLEQNEALGAVPYIIKAQKEIEQLILQAKDRYGIDTVLLEGMDIQAKRRFTEILGDWDVRYNKEVKVKNFEGCHALFNELVDLFNFQVKAETKNQRPAAIIGYFMLNRLNSFSRLINDGTNMVPEYITARVSAIHDGLSSVRALQGDNFYVVGGAAEKLWIEGKINLVACDDRVARLKAEEWANTKAPAEDATNEKREEFQKSLHSLHQPREDAVITAAAQWMKKQKKDKAMVVFGYSHDFSSNATNYNQTVSAGQSIGLIKLEPLVVDELISENKNFKYYIDLTDE